MGFATTAGGGSTGIMVIDPKYRSSFSLQKITQLGCHIRLYPALDESGADLPVRSGRQISDIGDWVNGSHFIINYIGGGAPGKDRITMLASIRGDEQLADASQRRGLRLWARVLDTLYGLTDSGQAPRHWFPWVIDSQDAPFGKKAKARAKEAVFARGLATHFMTQKGPKQGVSKHTPMLNCVFHFPPMAQRALAQLAMTESPDAENLHTDDWDKVFRFNSQIVHPTTGCLLEFRGPDKAVDNNANAGAVNFSGGANAQGGGFDMNKFLVECRVLEQCAVPMETIRQHVHGISWDDLLNVYKDEADMVRALEVGIPDDLLVEAFLDSPQYLSPRLLEKRNVRMQQGMIANAPYSDSGGTAGYSFNSGTQPAPTMQAAEAAAGGVNFGNAPAQPAQVPPSNPQPTQAPPSNPQSGGVNFGNSAPSQPAAPANGGVNFSNAPAVADTPPAGGGAAPFNPDPNDPDSVPFDPAAANVAAAAPAASNAVPPQQIPGADADGIQTMLDELQRASDAAAQAGGASPQ